ncbi:MAG: hypothetical protein QW727_00725 [Candidatus Pacearchaeota archaeon]
MKNKRGQGIIEFIVIFGAILFFFVLFLGVISGNINEKNKEKENIIVQNIALNVREEIALASKSSNGYSRKFNLPQTIIGKNYEVKIVNNSIYVYTEDTGVLYNIVPVNGEILKGENIIKKENGEVYLNQ